MFDIAHTAKANTRPQQRNFSRNSIVTCAFVHTTAPVERMLDVWDKTFRSDVYRVYSVSRFSEGRSRANHETFRITVRLDNGAMRTVIQGNITALQAGDRLRLDGNLIYRM